jgi:hypothetical protein
MFIRFVSGKIDEDSLVAAGLFCAASELRWSEGLPDYEFEALKELRDGSTFIWLRRLIICPAIAATIEGSAGSSPPHTNTCGERGN